MTKNPKAITHQTPTTRPEFDKAMDVAIALRSATRSYARAELDMQRALELLTRNVADANTYGESMGHRVGHIATVLAQLSQSCRLDLLAKYATNIDINSAVLAALMPTLTDEEATRINNRLSL